MSLGSHPNVYNTCLRILRTRGFALKVEGEMTVGDDSYPADALWIARQGEFIFRADNPIELLGLVAIYDHVQPTAAQPYWWSVPGADIRTELLDAAFPDPETDA